jgi:DNA-directed RNA polymerase specialized sigma24 family protein
MDNEHSVTYFIANLKEGKQESVAQQEIWNRYFARLVALARAKLGNAPRGMVDEEDVALSALNSFFNDVAKGKFPKLTDRVSLWPLLATITARKALNQRRRAFAKKIGAGKVRGESAFMNGDLGDLKGIDNTIEGEVTAEFADELILASNELIESLKDPQLRIIAIRKLHGYTTTEIARELNCVKRTVERKIELIRDLWRNKVRGRS